MNGREHFQCAEHVLERLSQQEKQADSAWLQAWATVALAHATLAAAARDYGLHVSTD